MAADAKTPDDNSGVLNDAETQEKLMAEILAAGEERRKKGLPAFSFEGDWPTADKTMY